MAVKYDLIIVGAGTAGSVLAERLTRTERLRVLLVEAGGRPASRFVSTPAGFPKLFRSDLDWAFESEPQTHAGGRRIFTPRGRMLGGSSNMNAMMHQWCHPCDFQGWVDAGASGWGWDDVSPVFRSQERWLGDVQEGRGHSGPMVVSPNGNARPLSHHFVESARSLGLGDAPQYNARAYEGAWIAELACKDGKRFSAYDAFLLPAMKRSSLEVVTDAQVTRVLVERGVATGVTARRGDREETWKARGVVLAAGAFGSAHLLLLSGIGPPAQLRSLGVDVSVESPDVGENLQDHPVLPSVYRTGSTDTLKSAESPWSVLRYLVSGRGMLASNGVEGFAFTQIQPGPVSAPDLELIFLPFEYRPDLLEPPREHAFGIGAAVVAPQSRGTLRLRSADPEVAPAIDFGLLSDRDGVDRRVLCEGVRLARRIASTPPLAADNAGELRPGEEVESDDALIDYAGTQIQTVYHPTSTCRMGSDARSVVDPQLRVRGVDRLWVADASVMPSVPRGHPNAVVAMIADRGGTWIEEGFASPGAVRSTVFASTGERVRPRA